MPAWRARLIVNSLPSTFEEIIEVTVDVEDVNEAPTLDDHEFILNGDPPPGLFIGRLIGTDHDAGQAILPLKPNEKILIGDDVENEPPRPVWLDLAPVLAARIVGRRFDDAVVLGAVGIGEDNEAAIVMVDRIVVFGFAR